ncbi:MAG TPA: ABC transporter ATPase [Bacteroidia bacterium]
MNGRVWAYLSSKELSDEMAHTIADETAYFLDSWNAHGTSLAGEYEIRDNRFLIIKVDEEKFGASGCSIDKQLKFIKETEQKFAIELLNRLLVAYKSKSGKVEVVHASKIKDLFATGEINEDTIIYNASVSTSTELENNFEIPLKQSWLNAKYQLVAA